METTLLIPFALATLVFMVTPGPGSLYCAAQSLAHGTRTGLRAALGLHVGGYIHVIAASLGLSVVFDLVPMLFVVFKILGAGVLIWMGLALIFRRRQAGAVHAAASDRATFGKAVLVEALNPTTALFFLAFLPQFVSPEAALPLSVQFLILGTVTGFAFSVTDLVYAFGAGGLRKRLVASRTLRAWAERVGGALLCGLGVKLLLTRSS